MSLSREAVWPRLLIAAAGVLLAAFWPLTSALSTSEMLRARLTCGVLTVVICVAFALVPRGVRGGVWMGIAIVSGVAAIAALLALFDANTNCVADHEGRSVIIGREYTQAGAAYVAKNPGQTASDLLLDTGGRAEPLWTSRSIASCRMWVSWGGLLNVPLFAVCVSSLLGLRPTRFKTRTSLAPLPPHPASSRTPVYDAFISYRHNAVDAARAEDLVRALESRGLRVAIDFRDFRENEHVVTEMERCVKESRFLLCVISAQYDASGFTAEEAIMSKTRDMVDRQRRIVPLIYERVALPMALEGLVGIDFTESASIDPIEKLADLLRRPATV